MTNEYTEEFLYFWKLYPARYNFNRQRYIKKKKWPAFEKWQKLSKEIHKEILCKAKLIKDYEGTARDAVTWLNNRGWDDIEIPENELHLPKELTDRVGKPVESHKVNVNNEVNRQKDALGVR